jgi:RyR domain
MTIEDIAKVCHEANRAYCETLGDTSQPPWEKAPAWQKDSARNGVKFHLSNWGASPSVSHEAWYREKEAAGWKYGPVKDPEKKEHPCFVPYNNLPVTQQAKDLLFSHVVRALRHLVP